jgi:fucose permease
MWLISGQHFFRASGYTFFGSWFAEYLVQTRGVTTEESGWATTAVLLAVVGGSVVGGVASDAVLARTSSRRLARQGVAVAAVLLCAGAMLAADFVSDWRAAVTLISAGSLLAAMSGPCAYTITIDMGGRHVATVFSIMNMAGNVGGIVFPPLAAALADAAGWDSVLYLVAGVYLAAGACWMLLNPAGTVVGACVNPNQAPPR